MVAMEGSVCGNDVSGKGPSELSSRALGCEVSDNPLNPLAPIRWICRAHHPDEDLSILQKAYDRAVRQHADQRRKSGEIGRASCRERVLLIV